MGKYILKRLLKSIVSLFVVMSIIIIMIFELIPRTKIFEQDASYRKLKGENKTLYMYQKWDMLGYLDFQRKPELCSTVYGDDSEKVEACKINGSPEQEAAITTMQDDGYEVDNWKNGDPYVVHEYNWLEILGHYFSSMIVIDSKNAVQDDNNPDLERGYHWEKNPYNGTPALVCSGCTYKYQLWFNGSFPFIHSNKIKFNFGTSYPTNQGISTLEVINSGQGSLKTSDQVFPTGLEQESAIIQTSCQYKTKPDNIDKKKFTDNYSNCLSSYENPSMVATSYIIGLISLIFAYAFGLPTAISMAQHKGKIGDKIGIAYINILIAVPSLAFIFFMRSIGSALGLPDKFPMLGFGDIRSYIMPVVILGLLNTPSLMMWVRRYMIDQSNQDYVKFAKAKGLSKSEIFHRHILRNAIIPIVNGIPSSVILCISGAFITETAFAVPGMGKMLPDAINQTNNNMIITLAFIFTGLSILAVFLGDILMTLVDPRIQLSAKGGE
ncbi:MAG: ABC transporter permease [Galactobacillus timonensis]|uniref:ABC transporter permease n=1 Tax=Galactobacillus timonensis TaxID=2041840 RepID=UPI002409E94B|nr:ABC transporter permease [Galactobacillus timonensis]MDD6600369.1 ABC transporter permease [Galactobacillus timonensis]MDD6679778.1 ABC transporter permease [Galactobacillus timonensis]